MMLRPQEGADQRLLDYALDLNPGAAGVRETTDAFGNPVTVADFAGGGAVFEVEARFTVDHRPMPLTDGRGGFLVDPRAALPMAYDPEEAADLARYAAPTEPAPEIAAFARRFASPVGETPLLSALAAMTKAIRAEFTYGHRLSGAAQTAAETLSLGSGACRDFAVLMMEAARALGLAARFVSGYVVNGPAKADKGPPRLGGGHTHAWLQVYLPQLGWVDFDPTNGLVGAEGLIRVATVRAPRQACVLMGDFDGDPADCLGMDVEVDVFEAGPEQKVRVAA